MPIGAMFGGMESKSISRRIHPFVRAATRLPAVVAGAAGLFLAVLAGPGAAYAGDQSGSHTPAANAAPLATCPVASSVSGMHLARIYLTANHVANCNNCLSDANIYAQQGIAAKCTTLYSGHPDVGLWLPNGCPTCRSAIVGGREPAVRAANMNPAARAAHAPVSTG